MHLLILAFGIGVIAGLRAVMPLAAVSWAARLRYLDLSTSPLALMGLVATPWVLSIAALGELWNDKRASTPSRKIPPQFIGRVLDGAFAGAAIGIGLGNWWMGLLAGAIGAVAGTLGGAAARGALAGAFGKDLPAALLEDAIAIGGSILIVSQL